MKLSHILPFAALAAAHAIHPPQQVIGDDGSMWDNVPSVLRPIETVVDTVAHSIDQALEIIARAGHNVASAVDDWYPGRDDDGRRHRNRHDDDDEEDRWRHRDQRPTVYELIRDSKQARKFTRLVDEHKDIRKRLDDTKAEYTVFVPTDEAFEKLPGHRDADRDFLEKLLEYHVVKGQYPVGRIMAVHTIPTMLDEHALNNLPQRLRVSVSLFGVHLNFYSSIVASNIVGRNGLVHAVDNVLVPPPRQGKLIESLPAKFSTFALAMEKTSLGDDLHRRDQRGGTVFAPTNNAWMKLGPEINEFLFSGRGRPYLRALLRYHVVMNETLYSDAYYEEDDRRRDHEDSDRRDDGRKSHRRRSRWEEDEEEDEEDEGHRRRHRRQRHRYENSEHDAEEASEEDFLHRRRPNNGDAEDDLFFAAASSSRSPSHGHRKDDEDRHYLDRALRGGRRSRTGSMFPDRHRHVSLETCLRHRTIEVDIDWWMGLVNMDVNDGKARVSVQDGVARDGVVQVIESVLIPPMHAGRSGHDSDRDRDFDGPEGISVSELRDRLDKFVDEEDDDRDHKDKDRDYDL